MGDFDIMFMFLFFLIGMYMFISEIRFYSMKRKLDFYVELLEGFDNMKEPESKQKAMIL